MQSQRALVHATAGLLLQLAGYRASKDSTGLSTHWLLFLDAVVGLNRHGLWSTGLLDDGGLGRHF